MKTIRLLLITTIILALIQIVLGITVRVTGSGLGCPDWPTCYGNWIPPLRFDSIIEYTHRLSASSLGLVTFITLGFLWFKRDLLRVSFYWICVAGILVLLASIFGAITVWTELEGLIVLIHLSIAELLVASLVLSNIYSWDFSTKNYKNIVIKKILNLRCLFVFSLILAFFVILSGGYMVSEGYGSVCSGWPLCNGFSGLFEMPYVIHMIHRLIVFCLAILIGFLLFYLFKHYRDISNINISVVMIGFVFVLQVLIGAIMLWTGFQLYFRVIHLAIATVFWGTLVSAAYIFFPLQKNTTKRN